MLLKIIILLFALGWHAQAFAAVFRLQQPETSRLLGLATDYAIDEQGTWTPEMAKDLPPESWTRSRVETPNFGYLSKPLWMQLTLDNASSQREWILSFPDASFVQITLWKKTAHGLAHLHTMNRSQGVADRPMHKRYYNVPLDLAPGERLDLLLRFEFQTTSSVPITVEGRESFEANYFLDTVLQCLYFGIMLSMFFYNGFLFIATCDRSYLYYIGYVLALSLMMLWIRDWFALLTPPAFILTAETCNTFAYGVLFFGALFVIHFVQDYHQSWLLQALRGMCCLCLPLTACLYAYDNPVFNQVALVILASLMIVSCVGVMAMACYRRRDRQTVCLLLAWSCVLIGGILFSFNRNGLLPQTLFFDYSIQFGSALEVLLLSFSLGDKINHERDLKILAQNHIAESDKLAIEARSVQDALIHGQQQVPGVEIASFYQSADITGGDWYGVFHDDSAHRLYIFMGDVTGHGIPSALVTAAVSGAIQSLVEGMKALRLSRPQTLEIMAQAVNRVVCRTGEKADRIMTMAFVCVDLDARQGTYLNAGHRPPLLVQGADVKPLICRGNMLGAMAQPEFETRDFALTPGTRLFLYTDGLFENQGPDGTQFREKQMFTLLREPATEPAAMMASIQRDLAACWQTTRVADDCALLLIEFFHHDELKSCPESTAHS